MALAYEASCRKTIIGSSPIRSTTLCTDGEIGHHTTLRRLDYGFESRSVRHFMLRVEELSTDHAKVLLGVCDLSTIASG